MNTTATIKCGNCKQYHDSVNEVRACFGRVGSKAPGVLSPAPVPVTDLWANLDRDVKFEISSNRTMRRASEKQVRFINSLLRSREHGLSWNRSLVEGLTPAAASWTIEALLEAALRGAKDEAPVNPEASQQVPAGRYAVEMETTVPDGTGRALQFYRVDRPTEGRWAGATFVKVQASDEFHRAAQPQRVLAEILRQGVEECSLRYGRELGHCGVCGRTLTDPDSRARGIGPICADKMGW